MSNQSMTDEIILEARIEGFLQQTLGQYSNLSYTMNKSDEETWEVRVSNDTNNSIIAVVLRPTRLKMEILKGEDFYKCNAESFFAYLFLCSFLTFREL